MVDGGSALKRGEGPWGSTCQGVWGWPEGKAPARSQEDDSLEVCGGSWPRPIPCSSLWRRPSLGSSFLSLLSLLSLPAALPLVFSGFALCLVPCQPLSLAVVVNRACDCQLQGLCGEPATCGRQVRGTSRIQGEGFSPTLSTCSRHWLTPLERFCS